MNNVMFFEGNEVEVFELNGKVLFNPYHVGDCLGISKSTIRDTISSMNEKQVVKLKNSDVKEIVFRKLNNRGENFLTESGVVQLTAKSRNTTKQNKLELLKQLNISNEHNNLVTSYREIEFFDKLETILEVFNIEYEKQYSVFNYRIDMFLPELNIAIEYDENNHKRYSYESQELRQEKIEKELGCKFIRVSDEDSDELNIGLILKEFMEVR